MGRRLIIDTNLLLLLVIGAIEEGRHIRNSKRLNAFDKQDYQVVLRCMENFDKVFITPYIATEVSNLIDLRGYARIKAYKMARVLFSQFKKINPVIDDDCAPDYFLNYGITDSSLILLAPNYHVLTDDRRILAALYTANPKTILPYELIKQLYLQ